VNAFEKAESVGGDFELIALQAFLDKPTIFYSLERLDMPPKEVRKKIDEEEERSSASGQKHSKGELIKNIREVLIASAYSAHFHGRSGIDSESIFSTLAQSRNPLINKIFDYFSVDPKDVDAALVFGKFAGNRMRVPLLTGGFAIKSVKIKPHRVNRTFTSRPTLMLDRFSKDLTDLARAGVEGFLIGHQKEYDQMIDTLSRSGSRNALLVGEPGVGKGSIVAHLAFKIISDEVPVSLFDRRLVQLSIGDLISGAGAQELSQRLSMVVKEIISAGNIILYLPDIHLLSKTSQGGGVELSDLLMPIIKSDAFPVIGSTYPKEYKEFIETKSDFAGAFEMIHVNEITPQEAVTLLTYDAIVLERQYGIEINFSAIKQAVSLAAKYFHHRPLPESARELFKEAISMATQRRLKELTGQDIAAIVERKINVPIHKTGKEEAQTLLNLEEVIHRRYVDQDEAVTAVAEALRAYRSGLSRKGGPIATFLFVGPTGVGKTELSKILADIQFGSEKFMVRFDMSEYQQKDSISRFIGSPDGKLAGNLTEAIIERPYSLILLDEFEKAHPDILNLFLQVFDDGRLTDSLGRVVDFQNTIIIATSNAHSVYIQEQIKNGKKISDFEDEFKNKLFDFFKPELINRFSDLVVFKPLSMEDIVFIAQINLRSLSDTLMNAQGIELDFDDAVVERIAQIGYDPTFGARPLRKAIDDNIKSALSKKILSGDVAHGQKIKVEIGSSNEFIFTQTQ
jgi:ATP-dependent Clp protease ATP-binding subunit ClpC